MYPLAHKGMGPVSTFISGGPTWLKRNSRRDPAMVSTWQQDFRIFSGFPPRCLVHDQLSNTRHVHHSFCFLVVAPLVRMSWALVCWFSSGLHVRQLQQGGLFPPLGCTLNWTPYHSYGFCQNTYLVTCPCHCCCSTGYLCPCLCNLGGLCDPCSRVHFELGSVFLDSTYVRS